MNDWALKLAAKILGDEKYRHGQIDWTVSQELIQDVARMFKAVRSNAIQEVADLVEKKKLFVRASHIRELDHQVLGLIEKEDKK